MKNARKQETSGVKTKSMKEESTDPITRKDLEQ
jgi:hypothetical protein